mmetsp:Transcript_65174/g.172672  ORF Transcript_65174/g.172672 Transcript_65174/m.172672 type:complete len:221 (+) Transcript_65174:34-696(+)
MLMNTISKIPLGNAEHLRRLGIDLAKSLLSPEFSIDLGTVDRSGGPFPHQAPISASTTGAPSLRICSLTDNLFSLASKEAVACPSSCPPSSSDSSLRPSHSLHSGRTTTSVSPMRFSFDRAFPPAANLFSRASNMSELWRLRLLGESSSSESTTACHSFFCGKMSTSTSPKTGKILSFSSATLSLFSLAWYTALSCASLGSSSESWAPTHSVMRVITLTS